MEQYKSLRAEIATKIATQEKLQHWAAFGTLVVWAWLLEHPSAAGLWYARLLPVVLMLALFSRLVATSRSVVAIGRFVAKYERHLGVDKDDLGWEASLREPRVAKESRPFSLWVSSAVWVTALLAVNVALMFLVA